MSARSWLFVPGDSTRKMDKGLASAADALIIDLEDSVSPDRTDLACGMSREFLLAHPDRSRQQLWVRVNPLTSGRAIQDLAAVVPGRPDGIVLPKVNSGHDIAELSHYLTALEAAAGLPNGQTGIVCVATETAASLFQLGSYAGVTPRLAGLTWGAEDLSAALGASTNRLENGEYEFTYQLARSLCLAGASAAGVIAIDTVFTDFRNAAGLEASTNACRRAGFSARIAIHPDQVDVINRAFTPSEEDIAFAQRVIDLFAANPGAGTLGLDGKMLDRPHLKQAQNTLDVARRLRARAG
jgi:citrate lyase subunit beta/citryl-CoA lyase